MSSAFSIAHCGSPHHRQHEHRQHEHRQHRHCSADRTRRSHSRRSLALLAVLGSLLLVFHEVLSHSSSYVAAQQDEPGILDPNAGNGLDELGNLFGSLLGGLGGGGGPGAGGSGGCEYTCPNGAVPVPNPDHVPQTNGCGSGTMLLTPEQMKFSFTKCCDEHDFCYDTCGKNRDTCDSDFKACLEGVCRAEHADELEECMGSVGFFYFGTAGFGCGPYLASQKNACLCPGAPGTSGSKRQPSLSSKLHSRGSLRGKARGDSLNGDTNKPRRKKLPRQARAVETLREGLGKEAGHFENDAQNAEL